MLLTIQAAEVAILRVVGNEEALTEVVDVKDHPAIRHLLTPPYLGILTVSHIPTDLAASIAGAVIRTRPPARGRR